MGMGCAGRVLRLFTLLVCLVVSTAANAHDAEVFQVFRTQYAELVTAGEYRLALSLVCDYYGLPCHQAKFKLLDHDDAKAYAYTGLDGKIELYPAAFHHSSEGIAHPGWLAAVVGHELVHVEQGSPVGLVYAQLERIYRKNHLFVAARELEGWQYMFDNAERFSLNCAMYQEIEFSREYFEWIVAHKGQRPPHDSVPPDIAKFNRLRKRCLEWTQRQANS